ncbi:hypothetical protein Q5O89_18285 [Peribacillus frigoritolerans]|nr:hypothetical protein [Peribacillus frigoritolerans]
MRKSEQVKGGTAKLLLSLLAQKHMYGYEMQSAQQCDGDLLYKGMLFPAME